MQNLNIVPAAPRLSDSLMGADMRRRRYQQGTIELSNGNWTGRYLEDVILANGDRKRVHKRVFLGTQKDIPTEKLARRKFEPIIANINSNGHQPKTVMTLREFLKKWEPISLSNYKPGTARNFKTAFNYFLPVFGDRQLSNIQLEDLQRFVASLKASPAYIRVLIVCFRAVWKCAQDWGYVSHNPFVGLRLPRIPRTNRYAFTVNEVNRILENSAEPYKTMYWLLAQTGLRIGEVLGLKWEDVDLEKCVIQVKNSVWRGKLQTPKTDASARSIPVSPKLIEHLRVFSLQPSSGNIHLIRRIGLLFPSRVNGPLKADYLLSKYFKPLLASLGIQDAGFHSFRHANATFMDSLHMPMKMRQNRLGHKDAETTMDIYTHMVEPDGPVFAAKFDELIAVSK